MAGRKVIKDKLTGELKLVPRKSPPNQDTVFRRLERSLPRDELMQIFDGIADERFHQLYEMMCDKAWGRKSLPQLAKECGLSYAQVLQAITRGRLDQGMLRMSAHVPQVMEDVAIDAKSRVVTCATCHGLGHVETIKKDGEVIDNVCDVCDGVGKLRKIGDADSRKLMFETLRLTGRGNGPAVQVNVGTGAAMEDTVASVRDVLEVKALPAPPQAQGGGPEGGS